MSRKRIICWIRPYTNPPPPPLQSPLGRAAHALEKEGIDVWLASSPHTWVRASESQWEAIEPQPVDAIYDRYSSRSLPENYWELESQCRGVIRGNCSELIRICTDKVSTQRVLKGLPFPEISTLPSEFDSALKDWKKGYLKPRFGGLGRGVVPVEPQDPLPPWGPGVVRGTKEPTFLQRSIEAPLGYGSLCVRWLLQKNTANQWLFRSPVARVSKSAVANVHQGARALPAEEILPEEAIKKAREVVHESAVRLDNECPGPVIELGVDLVFDAHFSPWIIEVNSRPSGRLSALASIAPQKYKVEALSAAIQPFRTLAQLA